MAEFELVAQVDDIGADGRLSVIIDDVPALLLRLGADLAAIEDVCSHDGQPLTDGPIHDESIMCPRHGARFNIRTGAVLCMPATESIRVFDVEVRDDGIYARPHDDSGNSPVSTALSARDTSETKSVTLSPVAEDAAGATSSGDSAATLFPDDLTLVEALKQVIDPELMINVVDLGLVYSIERVDEAKVGVEMTLTSPACPAGPQIMQQARMALERLDGVTEAEIKLTMTPPWSPDRMTDDARDQLGIF